MIFRQALRFGVSGVGATAAHVLVASMLMYFEVGGAAVANAIAFCAATVLSYFANTLWSFSAQVGMHNSRRFVLVSLLGLGLTTFVASVAEHWGAAAWQGIAAVVMIIPPTTFFLHRRWTFGAPG